MASKTAPAKTPVPAPAASLTFEDAPVPTVTRAPKDNPFTPVVSALKDHRDTSKVFTVPADDAAKHIRLAQQAGKALGVTVRNKQEDAGNGSVKVQIWAVDRITRPRKDKSESK